ncbi:MAG: acetate kinase [Burkholderiales bacterium]|nr:acetate kinase [Burkholderiales bacterium]
MNIRRSSVSFTPIGLAALALLTPMAQAQTAQAQPESAPAAQTPDEAAARLQLLRQQVDAQTRQLEALKRSVAAQEASLNEVRRAVANEVLAGQRGAGTAAGAAEPQAAQAQAQAQAQAPVGQAPESTGRTPAVAKIFEQPGVLTPKGKMVLEPSLQYSYSSTNRIALVGYTIIPAITIGLIDVREVKRNTVNAMLTGRYGITNRFEVEARVPYTYRSDSSIGCQLGQGCASETVFGASGQGIGDVEVTGRYQFNDGGVDKPYYVGSLRFKSRTGKDPFQVPVDTTGTGLGPVQTELPTGSGFYGLQPALTVLFPSDPAVFFGTISYLHNFSRTGVVQQYAAGTTGDTTPHTYTAGDVIGFNFGMGLGLNEKSSFSIGYDHASVGRTKVDGSALPLASVRVQLGTLLLGYSYRLNNQRTLSVTLGAGITRDTPDMTLTVRMPITF